MENGTGSPQPTGPHGPDDQPSGPSPVPSPIPRHVAVAATQRRLGAYLDTRASEQRGRSVAIGCGTSIAAFVAMAMVAGLTAEVSMFDPSYGFIRAVVITLFFLSIGMAFYALRGLVRGNRVNYLFADGIVHAVGSRTQTVLWPEITQLVTEYERRAMGSEGKILGYRVESSDGDPFMIPLTLVNGRDPFVDHVVEQLRSHNRPIVT